MSVNGPDPDPIPWHAYSRMKEFVLPAVYMAQFVAFLVAMFFVLRWHRDTIVESNETNNLILVETVIRVETLARQIHEENHAEHIRAVHRDRQWARLLGLPIPMWTFREPEPPPWPIERGPDPDAP